MCMVTVCVEWVCGVCSVCMRFGVCACVCVWVGGMWHLFMYVYVCVSVECGSVWECENVWVWVCACPWVCECVIMCDHVQVCYVCNCVCECIRVLDWVRLCMWVRVWECVGVEEPVWKCWRLQELPQTPTVWHVLQWSSSGTLQLERKQSYFWKQARFIRVKAELCTLASGPIIYLTLGG